MSPARSPWMASLSPPCSPSTHIQPPSEALGGQEGVSSPSLQMQRLRELVFGLPAHLLVRAPSLGPRAPAACTRTQAGLEVSSG